VNAPFAAPAGDVLVTADGYERLRSELDVLRTERSPEMTELLRAAREDGDSDNPAVYELLEAQAQLEQRIAQLEEQLAAARVVTPAQDGSVGIGSRVRVRDCDGGEESEYDIVGLPETDVGNGRVSVGAPVGRALVGRRAGETVAVETPRGTFQLEIVSVRSTSRTPARKAA
jgi:transcription elongation factor GreA